MTLTIEEKFALLQDMKVIDNNRKIVERLKKLYKEMDYLLVSKWEKGFGLGLFYGEVEKILGEKNETPN